MKRFFPVVYTLYIGLCIATLLQKDMWDIVMPNVLMCLLFACCFMTGLFVVANRLKRYDMVDVGWGLCFMVIAATSYVLGEGGWVQGVVTGLVAVWGSRLAWHIGRRIRRTAHEDERYVELRKNWRGNLALNTFLRVYLVQALLALLVCVPVMHVNLTRNTDWSLLASLGLVVWLAGFLCEAVADRQLASFLANPKNKGKLMSEGLWKNARYPNYFGEITMWWGIALIALGTPYGWVALGGAALITYLIVYISGIPLKEARLRKREGWKEYVASTRLLLPVSK